MKYLILLLAFLSTPALAGGPDRVSILAGSHHAGAKIDFEQVNPGVFLTWEGEVLDWSVGAYRNSFGKPSVAATVGLPVVAWRTGEASLFAGVAYYPEDGRTFAVHAGDFVPIGGLQIRQNNLFMQVIPSDSRTVDTIFSLGVTLPL